MTRWFGKTIRRDHFLSNLSMKFWMWGDHLSKEHYLEFMGTPKVKFVAWKTNWGIVLTLDNLLKRGRPLVNRC